MQPQSSNPWLIVPACIARIQSDENHLIAPFFYSPLALDLTIEIYVHLPLNKIINVEMTIDRDNMSVFAFMKK